MELVYKNNELTIESEKKSIVFGHDGMILDGMLIEMAGEYEKGGFLLHVLEVDEHRYYELRVEGYTVWYIPDDITEIASGVLDFLGDIDVLIVPGSKVIHPVIEKIEPRLIAAYGPNAHELGVVMGVSDLPVQKYKLKEADLVTEKTPCIVFWM